MDAVLDRTMAGIQECFNCLVSDRDRWAFVLDNKHRGIEVVITDEEMYAVHEDDSEMRYKMSFERKLQWSDELADLCGPADINIRYAPHNKSGKKAHLCG